MARSKKVSQNEMMAFQELRESKKKKKGTQALMPEMEGKNGGEEEEDSEFVAVGNILGMTGDEASTDGPFNVKAKYGLENDMLSKANIEKILESTGKNNTQNDKDTLYLLREYARFIEDDKRSRMSDFTSTGQVTRHYNEFVKYCDTYINKRNPWTKMGKQRLAMVKAFRWQANEERKLVDMGNAVYAPTLKEDMLAVSNDVMTYKGYTFDEMNNNNMDQMVAQSLKSKYDLTDEDMRDIMGNYKRIGAYKGLITGNDTVDIEALNNVAKGYKRKKELKDIGGAQIHAKLSREENEKCLNEAMAYAKDKLGVDLDNNVALKTSIFSRFSDMVMDIGHDDATKEKNARLIIDMASDNDDARLSACETMINKWLSIDINKEFERLDPDYVVKHFAELHRKVAFGFVFKRNVMDFLRSTAGVAIDTDLKQNLIALGSFYEQLGQYLSGVLDAYMNGLYLDENSLNELSHQAYESEAGQEPKGDKDGFDDSGNDATITEYTMKRMYSDKRFKDEDQANMMMGLINTTGSRFAKSLQKPEDILKQYGWKGPMIKNVKLKLDDSGVSDATRKGRLKR